MKQSEPNNFKIFFFTFVEWETIENKNLYFKYIDEENDTITIKKEVDFQEAVNQADAKLFLEAFEYENKEEFVSLFENNVKKEEILVEQKKKINVTELTPFFQAKYYLEQLGFEVDAQKRNLIIKNENNVVEVLKQIALESAPKEEDNKTPFFKDLDSLNRMGFKDRLANSAVLHKKEYLEETILELLKTI